MPSCQPDSARRQHLRARAVGPVPGGISAHAAPRKHGQLAPAACRKDTQLGEGGHRTADAPHNGESPSPQQAIPRHSRDAQHPAGHASQGVSSTGSPRLHTHTYSK